MWGGEGLHCVHKIQDQLYQKRQGGGEIISISIMNLYNNNYNNQGSRILTATVKKHTHVHIKLSLSAVPQFMVESPILCSEEDGIPHFLQLGVKGSPNCLASRSSGRTPPVF